MLTRLHNKLFTTLAVPPSSDRIHNSLIFLSPGRSGTHLVNVCLQHFTRRPLLRFPDDPSASAPFRHRQYISQPPRWFKKPYFHSHFASQLSNVERESNLLLAIIRNPKEHKIRRAKEEYYRQAGSTSHPVPRDFIENFLLTVSHYYGEPMDHLFLFDQWPAERRLLLYYEDCLERPRETIQGLMKFIGDDNAFNDARFEQYQALCRESIEQYSQKFADIGGSMSKGETSDFHCRDFDPALLRKVDAMLEKKFPDCWNKYLSHYATP
jgi:hypothetical protein